MGKGKTYRKWVRGTKALLACSAAAFLLLLVLDLRYPVPVQKP